MNKLHIITPVKDSLEMTLQTIAGIMNSEITVDFSYTVYNDFSTDANTEILEKKAVELGFNLVNLKQFTMHPSPNYLMILQRAQQSANFEDAHLLIIESDVIVEKNTIQQMVDSVKTLDKTGMIAAITTDVNGKVNFPYLYARKYASGIINTRKRLSFCCTLITQSFLAEYNFDALNPDRNWFDAFLSRKSIELGFNNYLQTSARVVHIQHSMYPWKHIKHSQPIKYYWKKLMEAIFHN